MRLHQYYYKGEDIGMLEVIFEVPNNLDAGIVFKDGLSRVVNSVLDEASITYGPLLAMRPGTEEYQVETRLTVRDPLKIFELCRTIRNAGFFRRNQVALIQEALKR
jgi:hypothetical protein